MKLIAAVNDKWGIGMNNELLYHLPGDMKFFKSKTEYNTIIIGRKTLESFPGKKPLKNRENIVLTRNADYECEDITLCTSTEYLLELLRDYDTDKVYVCGGEEIYRLLLPLCDTAYITKVEDNADCNKFFPCLDENDQWELSEQSEKFCEKGLIYSFCTYKKVK